MAVGDTLNTSEARICGALGVHPVVLGLGAGSAQSRVGAATTELERAAWNNSIIPLQDTISQQITRQLIPEFVPEEEIDEWLGQIGTGRTSWPCNQTCSVKLLAGGYWSSEA